MTQIDGDGDDNDNEFSKEEKFNYFNTRKEKYDKIIYLLISCIISGVIPTLLIINSKFYQLNIFKACLSKRFFMTIFYDKIFNILNLMIYIYLLFISLYLFIADIDTKTNTQKMH